MKLIIRLVTLWSCGFATALWIVTSAAQDAGQPMLGPWGFDAAAMSHEVKPGDDFFRYVNGRWIDQAVMPADKSLVSRDSELSDRIDKRLHEILQSGAPQAQWRPDDISGKVQAFYQSFMDETRVERLGAKPIARQLTRVRRTRTPQALAALMGRNNFDFYGTLFNISIDVDLKEPRHYAVYLAQSGLGLPDRDYYLEKEFSDKKAAYESYVQRLLSLLGWPQAKARARNVVEFETQVAAASWTKTQDRDLDALYNPMSRTELAKLAPQFDWEAFLTAANLPDVESVIVEEKSAFPKLGAVYARTPAATLQAWEAFQIADNAAPYLSSAFAQAWFELHERVLEGQQQQRVRWKRALTAVSGGDFAIGNRFGSFGTMGWAVGQLYTARYFQPQSKAQLQALVLNLMAAYRARIEKLDWMSDATRAEALEKLDTYTVKIGYPDHPRDYSGLIIRGDDLTGNVLRAARSDWDLYVHRLPGPVDRSDWSVTPQTVDAYNGLLRDVVFPAGILQPPAFDPNADPAINYGGIGAIIGHELTHGFDDQGRKIDAAGALRDWWTSEDAKQFEQRATRLGAQYSQYRPLSGDPTVHVNGELTMGENIADLGGLTLALDAYERSLAGRPSAVIDGFNGEQRVFFGWAQAWCGKATDDYLRKQIMDPHSPRRYRVDGVVRNIDAWYAAFEVQPSDGLYLPPEQRVRIW